jgi:hypothetical protein
LFNFEVNQSLDCVSTWMGYTIQTFWSSIFFCKGTFFGPE